MKFIGISIFPWRRDHVPNRRKMILRYGKGVSGAQRFAERIYWLISLRWIAVIGVFFAVFFVDRILNLSLFVLPLYVIAAIIGFYNLVFFLSLLYVIKEIQTEDKNKIFGKTHLDQEDSPKLFFNLKIIANLQISFDLFSLAALIHFSGGIENPFVFYFIFHMIIASILLSRRASILQATVASFLFCSMVTLEYSGVLQHHCLKWFVEYDFYNNRMYIIGNSFVFISTLYIAVYMATSISRRLRRREKKLKITNDLLMEKDRLKSEYVMRVTHDIKGHLAAIQSCIEPVTTEITGPLNVKQMDLLNRADKRTEKLLFFVQKLLEITRLKLSGKIKKENFSFEEVMQDAITHVSVRAEKKGISLNSDIAQDMGDIRGEREYILETIINLLANAIKYTPGGGRVDLAAYKKDGVVSARISDTGIGIPKGEVPRIFEEFFRATNAKKTERDGTGLGLSIAKHIIERHGGKIWAESEEGKGTTINLILPK